MVFLPKMTYVGLYYSSVDCFQYFVAVFELSKHSYVLSCTWLGSPSKEQGRDHKPRVLLLLHSPQCLEERGGYRAQSNRQQGHRRCGIALGRGMRCQCTQLLHASMAAQGHPQKEARSGLVSKTVCPHAVATRFFQDYAMIRARLAVLRISSS